MQEELETNYEVEYKKSQQQLDSLRTHVASLQEQIQTLNITVEVANERWIKAVNENMQLEIELRKLKASR